MMHFMGNTECKNNLYKPLRFHTSEAYVWAVSTFVYINDAGRAFLCMCIENTVPGCAVSGYRTWSWTVASIPIYVTSYGSENRVMFMSCWNVAKATFCLVWTTEVAWGHAGSLIYRLNLATHCHMGHEWACYPVRQSASHLCPSLASLQSAATQWGHFSGLPVRHGFHFNINYSKNLAVFANSTLQLVIK